MKDTDDQHVDKLREEPERRSAAEEPLSEEQASYMRTLGESGGPYPEEITKSQAAERISEARDEEERAADRPGRGTQETYRGQREDD
jgi:hypothetical protein